MKSKCFTVFSALVPLILVPAYGGDIPPPDSKPLSVILKSVEQQGLGSLSEAEFDKGLWAVKVCDADACQKIYVEPKTGEKKHRTRTESDDIPPEDAIPLSTIAEAVENSGQGEIGKVELEDGYWEIGLIKDDRETKLAIDPMTGDEAR